VAVFIYLNISFALHSAICSSLFNCNITKLIRHACRSEAEACLVLLNCVPLGLMRLSRSTGTSGTVQSISCSVGEKHCVQGGRPHRRCKTSVCRCLHPWTSAHGVDPCRRQYIYADSHGHTRRPTGVEKCHLNTDKIKIKCPASCVKAVLMLAVVVWPSNSLRHI
jgi:hypothetical protein